MEKHNITLIYNNPNPESGGIPRYVHELIKRIPANHIDFTPVYGKGVIEKLVNVLYRRRHYFYKHVHLLSEINHFLQPEIFFNIKGFTKLVTIHDLVPLFSSLYDHTVYELGRKILLTKRFKETLENADFFIADTNQTKNELVDYGIDEEKIEVVNLGVDEKFHIDKKFSERKNIIGYVGGFSYRKGVDRLMLDYRHNFNALKNFKLVLAGGGVEYDEFYKKYNKLPNVIFKGRIPERKIVGFYNSLKAFVFPTRYEGFGLPIIEAVACGTPCFIYKDAKISEEVRKYTIEIESISEIPERLEEVKESKLKTMSKKVKREFSWEKTAKKTWEIYEEIYNK